MLPLLILKYFDAHRLLHSVISATKLYQNPFTSSELYQTPPNFTCLAVHLRYAAGTEPGSEN